ncbi:MAG TPA: hypothetical protein DCL81_01235 [Algoriphagus sp.]|nr:hypothetical protein [Algoriphagus sp.]MAN86265.1 hypothetical protein [Algoriphagus sp.]HAH35213.1 hypothetical protein [Algoriphagus sp.]HCH45841.1 hypothetical protein [Algoriphagus sp.]
MTKIRLIVCCKDQNPEAFAFGHRLPVLSEVSNLSSKENKETDMIADSQITFYLFFLVIVMLKVHLIEECLIAKFIWLDPYFY